MKQREEICKGMRNETNKSLYYNGYVLGYKESQKKVLKLINELLPKYYEDGADEFAGQLKFALEVQDE